MGRRSIGRIPCTPFCGFLSAERTGPRAREQRLALGNHARQAEGELRAQGDLVSRLENKVVPDQFLPDLAAYSSRVSKGPSYSW